MSFILKGGNMTTKTKFNDLMNRMEIGIDECLPDLPAFAVDATEILNDAYYIEDLPRNEFNRGKRRINDITTKFFKECLCNNIRK